jgi:uncharacterized protein YprB with RNaseH-like and TPR domain
VDLLRKLSRVRWPSAPAVEESDTGPPPEIKRSTGVLDDLRARIEARIARDRTSLYAPRPPQPIALPGRLVPTADGDLHLLDVALPPDHHHGHTPVAEAFRADMAAIARLARDPSLAGIDPKRMLFLDTETTGLSGGTGTLPFLIGYAFFEDDSLLVHQLFLHRPGEERPMLKTLAERLKTASMLVTYNGKSFDLPLLLCRFVLNHVAVGTLPPHLDLLHAARRVYKRRLGTMRLTHVEAAILRMHRECDIEGREIPAIYWSYVRGGSIGPMAVVLEHNRNDVVALAALLGRIGAQIARVRRKDEPEDHLSIALAEMRAGEAARAYAFALAAAEGGGDLETTIAARVLMAKIDCQRCQYVDARFHLESALAIAPRPELHLRLARVCEHKLRDLASAITHAHCAAGAEAEEVHARRIARLERRISGSIARAR